MRNELPAASAARAPRGLVKVNGTVLPGWLEWEVDTNSFYSADGFSVRFALSMLPADRGVDWWSSQAEVEVEILAGFPADPAAPQASEFKSHILGTVDDLTIDWVGRVLSVTGRDLTAKLIDTKTSAKYPNLTASEIATKLAAKHDLTPVVTKTTTKVGRFYEIDRVRLQNESSEWDLLTWLAQEEQFAVFVRGKALHFQPKPKESQDPYVFRWMPGEDGGPPTFNGSRLSTSRNLTLARDIRVVVKSWNAKSKKGFSKTATATKSKNAVTKSAGRAVTPVQEFSYTIPGLTPEQATQRAQQLLAELSRQEMKLSIDGPADNLLDVTDVLKVEGTGTLVDQSYFPDSIARSMSRDGGYSWRIEAKNHSPESEVGL